MSSERTPLLKEGDEVNSGGVTAYPASANHSDSSYGMLHGPNGPTTTGVTVDGSSSIADDPMDDATGTKGISVSQGGPSSSSPNAIQSKRNKITENYSNSKKFLLFAIMLLVNVLGPLSTEAQVPALQDIADDLNTSAQWVQLTITIYMLFFGASQLFFGTLSDMYGRRPTLIIGMFIYVTTNVACALSPNVASLNVFRAIQAIGSGAGMVIVYAIARDCFEQDQRTQVLGILGGIRPIVIASSPVFGGTVTHFLGWRFIFWIIGGLSFGLFVLVVLMLPETRDVTTVNIATVADYRDTVYLLIKKKIFVGLVIISGAVYAGVFIMFNEFSFVLENRYGFSELNTGLLCGLIVFGLMIGSLISIGLVKLLNPITVVLIGVFQLFGCGIILCLPFILFHSSYPDFPALNYFWTLVPLFGYVMADGLMLPHLISTALEPFKAQAGTASALAGFWRFFSAAVVALIVSSSSEEHLMTLHFGMAAMALASGVMYAFTLWGTDSTEFTASRDASSSTNTPNKMVSVPTNGSVSQNAGMTTGVTVVPADYEVIEDGIHSIGNGSSIHDIDDPQSSTIMA